MGPVASVNAITDYLLDFESIPFRSFEVALMISGLSPPLESGLNGVGEG